MRVDLLCLRPGAWRASCSVGGTFYHVVASDCASKVLAQRLVKAGIADEPMLIYDHQLGARLAVVARSFHRLAQLRTHSELAQYLEAPPFRERLTAA